MSNGTVREVTHIAGDRESGLAITHHLDQMAAGQVTLIYTGAHAMPWPQLEVTCEVYEQDGVIMVHALCPKCHHAIRIDGSKKAIEYDKARGLLKSEPFECTWEMDDWRREFGASLCGLRMAFDGKVLREA